VEINPIQNDVRSAQRLRRLPPDAICMFCDECDPVALEVHHVVRRDNDEDLTVVVCKNCHAKQHEELLKVGVTIEQPSDRTRLEINATVLKALSVLFQFLARKFAEMAQDLYAEIKRLDTVAPQWRPLPMAGI
jgi:RNase P subunit RPR2